MYPIIVVLVAALVSHVAQGADYKYNSQKFQEAAEDFQSLYKDYKTAWFNKLRVLKSECRTYSYLNKLNTLIATAEELGKAYCVNIPHEYFALGESVIDEAINKCNDDIPNKREHQLEKDITDTVYKIQKLDAEVEEKKFNCYGDRSCLDGIEEYAESELAALKTIAIPATTRSCYFLYNANVKDIVPCIADETTELNTNAKSAVNSIKECLNNELSSN